MTSFITGGSIPACCCFAKPYRESDLAEISRALDAAFAAQGSELRAG
jgi:hypothetical protein